MSIEHCEPAASIIKRLGGVLKVAEMTGLSHVQVQRWRWPREHGGTGGMVPHWHWPMIIEKAAQESVKLGPKDFVIPKKNTEVA